MYVVLNLFFGVAVNSMMEIATRARDPLLKRGRAAEHVFKARLLTLQEPEQWPVLALTAALAQFAPCA